MEQENLTRRIVHGLRGNLKMMSLWKETERYIYLVGKCMKVN